MWCKIGLLPYEGAMWKSLEVFGKGRDYVYVLEPLPPAEYVSVNKVVFRITHVVLNSIGAYIYYAT